MESNMFHSKQIITPAPTDDNISEFINVNSQYSIDIADKFLFSEFSDNPQIYKNMEYTPKNNFQSSESFTSCPNEINITPDWPQTNSAEKLPNQELQCIDQTTTDLHETSNGITLHTSNRSDCYSMKTDIEEPTNFPCSCTFVNTRTESFEIDDDCQSDRSALNPVPAINLDEQLSHALYRKFGYYADIKSLPCNRIFIPITHLMPYSPFTLHGMKDMQQFVGKIHQHNIPLYRSIAHDKKFMDRVPILHQVQKQEK